MRQCCCSNAATVAWRIALCCSLWGPYIMQLCDKASAHHPQAGFCLLDSGYGGKKWEAFPLAPSSWISYLSCSLFMVISAQDRDFESWQVTGGERTVFKMGGGGGREWKRKTELSGLQGPMWIHSSGEEKVLNGLSKWLMIVPCAEVGCSHR